MIWSRCQEHDIYLSYKARATSKTEWLYYGDFVGGNDNSSAPAVDVGSSGVEDRRDDNDRISRVYALYSTEDLM
jgi:hypothetical protein